MSDRVSLGDYAEITTGYPFKSSGYSEGSGIRLLRGDNIGQGKIRWEGSKTWPATEYASYSQYQLQVGDVILAMDRPWIEAGLKYAVLRRADIPSLLVQRVACLRARDGLDQEFLTCIIAGQDFTNYVLGQQTGTAVPHISARQISDYAFRLPSLKAQRAIGRILGALDDKIAVNDGVSRTSLALADAEFSREAASLPLGTARSSEAAPRARPSPFTGMAR